MTKSIFIELPFWLGDAIMATPAVQNIIKSYPEASITLFGSKASIEAYAGYPNAILFMVDESKKEGNRFVNLYKIAKSVGRVDLAISFRRSFASKFMLFFIDASLKANYRRLSKGEIHQCIRYNDFVNYVLDLKNDTGEQKLYFEPKVYVKPTLGINAGATYGSAKRWYPDRFAKVASQLASRYDIVIFGSPSEVEMAGDIEKHLVAEGTTNYQNLAGKTSIKELIEHIAGLSLFITNDSGPMHIASAYKVPTVAIFGPTKHKETSQWQNPKSKIVRHEIECSPCMRRECPLGHHECMSKIESEDVLRVALSLCYHSS